MPLPIIVVLERHWDTVPKKALMHALPFLKAAGYDTLCFESPCDKSESETIDGIETTLHFIETRLTEANQCLNSKGIAVNLQAMDYSDLELLLYRMEDRYMISESKFDQVYKERIEDKQCIEEKDINNDMKICEIKTLEF